MIEWALRAFACVPDVFPSPLDWPQGRPAGRESALRERHSAIESCRRVRVAVPTEDAGSITPRPEAQERGAGSPTPRARRNRQPITAE